MMLAGCHRADTNHLVKVAPDVAVRKLFGRFLAGLPAPSRIPIENAAKSVGIALRYEKLNISGCLIQTPAGKSAIVVDSDVSVGRQRFTIAHELGHFAANRLPQLDHTIEVGATDGGSLEKWCEAFASALLLPARQIKAYVAAEGPLRDRDAIQDAASFFGVSGQALQIRIRPRT